MNALPRNPIRSLLPAGLIALAGVLASPLFAQNPLPAQAGSLSERSPFLPPGGAAAEPQENVLAGGPLQDRFEFRGFYQINGVYHLLIKERNQPAGRWLRPGEESNGLRVENFDPEARTVAVYAQGQESTLRLAQIESNPSPLEVGGSGPSSRPSAGANRAPSLARRPGNIGSGSGGDDAGPQVVTRRPPPPPEWIIRRMRAQGIEIPETEGNGGPPESASPDFEPPPPPGYTPPDMPGAAPEDPVDDDSGEPTSPTPPTDGQSDDGQEPPFGIPGPPPSYTPGGGPDFQRPPSGPPR